MSALNDSYEKERTVAEWLTININPPKLDVNIVARTSNDFGYGAALDLFIFDSEIYTEEEAATHLQNQSKIEWMEIPE